MDKISLNSKFEKEINGKIWKFWVQRIPNDKRERALELFQRYFARDEPLCKSLNLVEDAESMEYFTSFLRTAIDQNQSLACFTKLDNGQNEIVAVNVCYQHSILEKIMDKEKKIPDAIQKILGTLVFASKVKDVKKEIGVEDYLSSVGLVVVPEYRGFNIGLHVLAARKSLCEEIGLKASVTTFTSPASQRLAEKAGFKDLTTITYDNLEKMMPSFKFPNINQYSKCLRNMYILYE